MVLLAAGSCDTLDDRYGRRTVTIPKPVGAATSAISPVTVIKPVGTQGPVARRDVLTQPEYYGGTGFVAGRPVRQTTPLTEEGELVSLNFVDTPLLEVVDLVLAQTLGLNYVFDERVQGSVTARTSEPIPQGSVLAMLENILALNGAALVDSAGVLHVVPIDAVAAMPKVVVTPSRLPQRAGTGIHIIPLRFASVASVQEIVATQVSPGNQLAVDPARNILIYTGPAHEARAIAEMVSVLDVDVLAGMSFALFPVEASNAADIAAELEAIFTDEAVAGLTDPVSFLPIERMNGVLAISARPSNLRQVAQWVRRLDRADAGAGQRVYVYYARNSRATELAEILNAVFGSAPARRPARQRARAVAPGLREVELIAPGLPDDDVEATELAADPMTETEFTEELQTVALGGEGGGTAGGPRFVADDRKNALLIIATPEQFSMIEAALSRVDILPLQVLIEATIAEVRLNDNLEYGLQWAFESGDLSASLTSNEFGSVRPEFPGFNVVLDAAEVIAVLRALAEMTDIEVVSSPQLMVLDNQQARLQVGDQVPIATQSAVSVLDPDAPIVNSIEYFDTGVILEVTPRVNETGLVTLDIVQEVSDAAETLTSGINSPTIQQRRISSTVAVQSGETVALGGLIRDRSSERESGIPVLKDVPVVGNMFKTTGRSGERTELLVLITPRVVRDRNEARQVTEELRARLTSLSGVVNPQ